MAYLKIRANQLFTGKEMLDSSWMLVAKADGTIIEVKKYEGEADVLFFEDGMVTPGLINCHCHLELSHLKGIITEGSGMVNFILQILEKRFSYQEKLQDAIKAANNEMETNGIVAVGDICNTADTINVKKTSTLYYQNFIETSGFLPQKAEERFSYATQIYNMFEEAFPNQNSIVPHAPYSVSSTLFNCINGFGGNNINSIHNQESEDENRFFENKSGDFVRLYKALNVNIDFFSATNTSSLQAILPYLNKKSNILVHNGYISNEDLKQIKYINNHKRIQFWFCFCVLANKYINNFIPTETLIDRCSNQIVIGTDSLASNHSLNLLNEIKYLQKKYPNVSLEVWLQAATNNGAKALGIDEKFGTFEKGKKTGIMLIKNLDNIKNIITS